MFALTVSGKPDASLSALFIQESDGHIRFGTAQSCERADIASLMQRSVRFADYLMEGRVYYSVQLSMIDSTLLIQVESENSARDRYIPSAIKSYIKTAGLTVIETEA